MSTELAFGANFSREKIVVGGPVKSTDSNEFWTFPIKYGTGQFGIMETATVTATKIRDDDKKPNILSQGFHLENPTTQKLIEEADRAIWEGLLKHSKADPKLPGYLQDANSVEDLIAAGKFIKLKGLLHRPRAKDSKGQPTKLPDMSITPLVYGKLIQCGAKHKDTPYKVFTKYMDAAVLNPEVRQRIADGVDKMDNYLIKAEDLWKKKLAFKAKWCMVVGDVFVSSTVCKIRRSITEVWIVSFSASESASSKAMASAVLSSGESFTATRLAVPTAAPDGDSEGDEGHDSEGPDETVVRNPIPGPQATPTSKFDVNISGGI